MYKIMNLETRAYLVRDEAIEETGQKHIIMAHEDGSEPEDFEEHNVFSDWLTDGKKGGAAQMLAAYAR